MSTEADKTESELEQPVETGRFKAALLAACAVFLSVVTAVAFPNVFKGETKPPLVSDKLQQPGPAIDPTLNQLLSETGATVIESQEEDEEELEYCVEENLWDPQDGSKEIGRGFSRYGSSSQTEGNIERAGVGSRSARPARGRRARKAKRVSKSRSSTKVASRSTRRRGRG